MSYKGTHRRMVAKVTKTSGRTRAAAIALAATAASGLAVAGAGVASAAPASGITYSQSGTYQFASDTYDYNGTTGDYIVNDSPESHSDSSQVLGSDGVDLSTDPSESGYADSGIIIPLGKFSTLFNASGDYVGPTVTGSANLGMNFYFGTNGSTSSFGTLNGSDVLTSADGDNYASVGVGGTSADFTTFAGYTGTDTSFTDLSGSVSMSDVKADYASEGQLGGENVKTQDPEVWAWIGISGDTAQQGYITSVNGSDLVSSNAVAVPNVVGDTASAAAAKVRAAGLGYAGQGIAGSDIVETETPAAGAEVAPGTNVAFTAKAPTETVVLSGGKVSDVTSSGFKASWNAAGAPAGEKYGLTLHFPSSKAENGRTASVTVTDGVYSGLPHGESGSVTIQPELNGVDNGVAGTVYVHTAS